MHEIAASITCISSARLGDRRSKAPWRCIAGRAGCCKELLDPRPTPSLAYGNLTRVGFLFFFFSRCQRVCLTTLPSLASWTGSQRRLSSRRRSSVGCKGSGLANHLFSVIPIQDPCTWVGMSAMEWICFFLKEGKKGSEPCSADLGVGGEGVAGLGVPLGHAPFARRCLSLSLLYEQTIAGDV